MADRIVTVPEEIDQHIDVALLHTDTRFRFRERLRKDPLFLIGSIIVALSLFLAAFGPHIAPYDPTAATAEIADQVRSHGTETTGHEYVLLLRH